MKSINKHKTIFIFKRFVIKKIIYILKTENLKGLVLETYGAGNAPTDDWFINLLSKSIASGIHIVNVTQCSGGSVIMGHYETSTRLKEIGVIEGKDILKISPGKGGYL